MLASAQSRPTPKRWLTLSVGYVTTIAGGTEVYTHRLNRALLDRGFDVHACFYANGHVPASVDGVTCHALRMPIDRLRRRERFAQNALGLRDFEELLDGLRPDVVHVNDRSPLASVEHLRAAKNHGAEVVATYHSSGFSCPGNALLLRGRTLCDGELRVERCTRCCLELAGLPAPAAAIFASADLSTLTRFLPPSVHHPLERRRGTAEYIERWHAWMESCDVITYVADWIRDLLLRNGVKSSKLFHLPLPPPGIPATDPRPDFWAWAKPDAFRLLVAGRVSDIKGTHVVVDAVRRHLMHENVALCVMGSAPTPSYARAIEKAVADDARIRWYPPQPEVVCMGAQLACDAVVVPSVSPETGPYSVLEAKWLGATVIGSDRGGIAELLRDYPRGFLFRPSDSSDLAAAVMRAVRAPRARLPIDRIEYVTRFNEALDSILQQA